MARLIGITGTIGAGKSTVGDILRRLGHTVVDTDEIVHELLASDPEVKRAVTDRFGYEILDVQGNITRDRLGAIVFADARARKDLEAIVHPATLSACRKIVDRLGGENPVFFLVPLLFETGLKSHYNEIWVVTTDEPVLRQRLRQRNGYVETDIDRRLSAQWSQADKMAGADRVIDNSGTIDATTRQIIELLKHYPKPLCK